MRFPATITARPTRVWLLALLVGALFGIAASAAQAAEGEEFGVVSNSFLSGACNNENPAEGCKTPATQAGSHPAFSVSTFTLNTDAEGEPFGAVKRIRVDSTAGFITNPHAIPTCTAAELEEKEGKKCPGNSLMGVDVVVAYNSISKKDEKPTEYFMYNMVPPAGSPADFGYLTPLGPVNIVGGVSWYGESVKGGVPTGDSHEYYTISGLSELFPLVSSTIVFFGAPEFISSGHTVLGNAFLTIPTSCTGPANTYLEVESYAGQAKSYVFNPSPLQTTGCSNVPFAPSLSLSAETTKADSPTGGTVEVKFPQSQNPTTLATAHQKSSQVTLPEGMTLDPSAANGLEACTEAQVGLNTKEPVSCPGGSKIGTVTVETPVVLPPEGSPESAEGVLSGSIYLGKRLASEAIGGFPLTIYVVAESPRYGLGLRLKGSVAADPETGRLTITFAENPQEPFSALKLSFNGGPRAPLANSLVCGSAAALATLTPWSGNASPVLESSPFKVDSNGSGGACVSPPAFTPTQSVAAQNPSQAGAYSPFTINFTRSDGQQYLSKVQTTLPAGLLGAIPSVPLCEEALANAGTCTEASKIGTVSVASGAGSEPYTFTGQAYLTGPYNGAPYGMSIVVPAVAGPFSLGNVVVRAAITVGLYNGRLTVSASLPTIFKGIPLRMKTLSISVNRSNFMFNPTNCGTLATESTLGGFVPGSSASASLSLSSAFQVSGCNTLAFKPSFSAASGAKTSKANGASIEVKMTQGAHQANIRQVLFTLPKQLPSRLTTLQKACPAATFEVANPPGACPSTSRVGGVTVTTPVLPGTLTGPAYLVSHGGEAFPDLDLILRGDGVEVVLVGHTHISKTGITTSKFESLPDVPISSVAVNLPVGSQSLLTGNGNLCTATLIAPTTIIAQSGTKITQKTKIKVNNCPVSITAHRTSGTNAIVTVQAPAAGRISGSGPDLRFVARRLGKAGRATISVPLSRTGAEVLRKFGRLRLKLRVGFVPKTGRATSKTFATVTFRA